MRNVTIVLYAIAGVVAARRAFPDLDAARYLFHVLSICLLTSCAVAVIA